MPQIERITKRSVDVVTTPLLGESRLWDSALKGFFLRVYATGRRVYAVKFRLHGRQGIYTIGVHGSPWTPEQARDAAREILARVSRGENPNEEKRRDKQALTVADLIDLYLREGPGTKPDKRVSSCGWPPTNDATTVRL